jgi:hypothetical protein
MEKRQGRKTSTLAPDLNIHPGYQAVPFKPQLPSTKQALMKAPTKIPQVFGLSRGKTRTAVATASNCGTRGTVFKA